jgi:hypothetical protein
VIVREEKVEESLYQDAKNRDLRRQLLLANLRIEEENTRSQKKMNDKSAEMIQRKQERELEEAFRRAVGNSNGNGCLSFEQFGRALYFLGFFHDEIARNEEEVHVQEALWQDGMDGEKFRAIMTDPSLAKELRKLSINRLVYNPSASSHNVHQQHARQQSWKTAMKNQRRPKSASSLVESGEEPRFETLLKKQKQVEDRIAEQRRKMMQEELAECTFKPKIITQAPANRQYSFKDPASMLGYLTNQAKERELKLQKMKEKEEKEKLEACTFRPQIEMSQKHRLYTPPAKAAGSVPGYEQAVSRMLKAKTERNHKPESFEDSLRIQEPLADSPSKTKVQPFSFELDRRKRSRPLLFLDVNLGPGKTGRIGIHEGDEPSVLAKNFAQAYKLDPVMTGRLEELLEAHMMNLIPGYVKHEKQDQNESSQYSPTKIGQSSASRAGAPSSGSGYQHQHAQQQRGDQEEDRGSYARQYMEEQNQSQGDYSYGDAQQDGGYLNEDDDNIGEVDENTLERDDLSDYGHDDEDGNY